MKVLRVYHAGRDPAHRARDRALVDAGVDIVLVVPQRWPDAGAESVLSEEPFEVVELAVRRSGDVNRHRYRSDADVRAVLKTAGADLLDLHEEPVSSVAAQWLRAADSLPSVAYTAQNVDKRFPPPFAQYERAALRRLRGLYPCSGQAASVARGKGFTGDLEILPLGLHGAFQQAGRQRSDVAEVVFGLVGRLVPEKGVHDALEVLADVLESRPARLVVIGNGPLRARVLDAAARRGVARQVELLPWQGVETMAAEYRRMHVLLVPSRTTETWAEQYGRVVDEARASGAVVVAFASGALPEVVGAAGLLVPEGDTRGLARSVTDLLADPVGYQALRTAGMRAAGMTAWPEVVNRQVDLYRRALDGSQGPMRRAAGRDSRRLAVAEFGPSASLVGGSRPFALPMLRRDSAWTRALAATLDRLTR